MRWRRPLKRLLLLLMFVCMTIKLHLELRMLDSSGERTLFPWRANDTVRNTANLFGYPQREEEGVALAGGQAEAPPGMRDGRKGMNLQEYFAHIKTSLAGGVRAKGPVLANSTNKVKPADNVKGNSSVINPSQKGDGGSAPSQAKANVPPKSLPSGRKPQASAQGSKYSNRKLTNDNSEAVKPAIKVPVKPARANPRGTVNKRVSTQSKKGVSHDVDAKEVSLTQQDIVRIKMELELENKLQTVYNEQQFGPVLANTSILLVQVHNRLENLRYLVEGMTKVRGIEQALVIFSHDFWDPDINAFVTNITKFRVMQIFFPYSIQLHPLTFPGRDPRDCSWNINRKGPLKCLNRAWPDSYGHYREASFTQIKHHWWWKIHRVFEGLHVTRNYTGHVVFLEEDHYVSPDLLHVLNILRRQRNALCPTCQVLALGNYNKMSTAVYRNYIERGDWWVTKHNLGFALDRKAWKTISTCKEQFCNFDDYNWDWTLNNLEHTCFKPKMSMLSVRFSRVVHVGSCGTHVKKNSCDVRREVQAAVSRFNGGKQWLFPSNLVLQANYRGAARSKKGNGGWGDLRDKQLCQAIGNGTASEETLLRLQFPDRE
ncbi:alpha-1,6-mannosyl-glycoprotein 2-beta-N-acetylglucosaminyltransferase-like [Penaeus indicus]|uniref:alpha-1,6-mannosyl-glycoprotein 2-beta-N-acetylglucosaminyltransferase-like n=1 Tax=Penaeus indicus TaxID=29960 RepID=UPI00300D4D62